MDRFRENNALKPLMSLCFTIFFDLFTDQSFTMFTQINKKRILISRIFLTLSFGTYFPNPFSKNTYLFTCCMSVCMLNTEKLDWMCVCWFVGKFCLLFGKLFVIMVM